MLENYTFTLVKSGKSYNVSQLIGSVSRKSSEDLLGEEVSFSKLKSLDAYFPSLTFELGDGLVIDNGVDEIFRGIITDESQNGLLQLGYTSFDYAFYLNKSKTIIQFNGIRGDEAIKKLCNKFSILIGEIGNIKTPINKIYNDIYISEIMKDILSTAESDLGVKFRMEMNKGKFNIVPYKKMIVTASFKPAANLPEIDVTQLIGGFNRTRSIADMKNSVIVISDQESASSVIASKKDDASIAKYGLIETVEKVSDKDIAQARNIVNNKLNEFNRIAENCSIELIGNDDVKACRILEINDPMTGLSGYYLVKECTHNYSGGIHLMQLTLDNVTESVLSKNDIKVLNDKKVASTAKKKRNLSVFDDGKNCWR